MLTQFMLEFREDTFSKNKNKDAHDHVDRVLNIVSLFNILKVSQDTVLQRVFPFTLTGSAKKWVDRLTTGAVNIWDLLIKAFIQRNISNSSDTDRLTPVISKLDNLGRDRKKLKENVHAIQVGCQICEGPHLVNKCPLNEEVKQVDEVKYGEFGCPAPFNGSNEAKFHVGPSRYYTRTDNQTPFGEKRPNLVETINKYMEGAAKRQVKTLTAEVETKVAKLKECKTIFANDGTPLYTPFYYSPEELEYFSSNSGFSDDEKSESTELKTSKVIPELKSNLPEQTINHYVEPYVPPIHFPNRLKQHAEEALVHETMESLKKIKINQLLLKEIRQTDNYPKYIKDLVTNKQLTKEDDEVRMNLRYSALLQNHLPPKENDPRSFILPCSIGRLDFNNALADLGASIRVMPFSMFKRLGIGKLKPIDMIIKMTDDTKCIPKGIVQESYEEIVYRCSLISQEANGGLRTFKERCDGGSLCHNEIKCYWESKNDGKQIYFEWENLSLNDWLRIRFGEVSETARDKILRDHWRKRFRNEYDDSEDFDDPDGCGESKEYKFLGTIINKLHDKWFKGTHEDDDNLEGIID
ncbi:hypothetical protein Tco_1318411 [Tanacetum coccineum]